MTDTKLCSWCRHRKPIAEFFRRSSTPDGLQGMCKPCASRTSRIREIAKSMNLQKERARKREAKLAKLISEHKQVRDSGDDQ